MVSIIIVNYKSWAYLNNCLISLKSISDVEVIVVDNASNDGELEHFSTQFNWANWVNAGKNLGFGGACNLGADNAKGEYFLFLNPDTEANEAAINNMHLFLKQNASYKIVSCQQEKNLKKHFLYLPQLFTLTGLLRSIYFVFNKRDFPIFQDKNGLKFIEPEWVSGSVVMMRKDWFYEINGWHTDYWMYSEDADICNRTKVKGGKLALLTDKHIYHKHGGASRKTPEITAMTKTEVIVSKHVYIQNNFGGLHKYLGHLILIFATILEKLPLGIIGFLFSFSNKIKVHFYILRNLKDYYFSVIKTNSWLSSKLKSNLK